MGIGSLVCIINLQIALAAYVWMRLGRQGKGTEEFSRPADLGEYSKRK